LSARYENAFPFLTLGRGLCGLRTERKRSTCTDSERAGEKPLKDLQAHRVLPAQRQEVLCALDGLGDFAQQFLQIFVAIDEINL